MSGGEAGFPGFWRFAWMFFMQPLLLHRRLKERSVDPRGGLIGLWRQGGAAKMYAKRGLQLLGCAPILTVGILAVCEALGVPVGWRKALVSSAFGAASCVTVAVLTGAAGVLIGVAAFGVAAGVGVGVGGAVAGAVAGVGAGLAFDVSRCVGVGVTGAVHHGVVFGLLFGLSYGFSYGGVFGAAFGVAFILTYFRLILLPLQVLLQALSNRRPALSPILWCDPIYLPLPGLRGQIEGTATHNPQLARETIEACQRSPGLIRSASQAQANLQAKEVRELISAGRLESLAGLQGFWLPGPATGEPLWQATREIARHAQSAVAAWTSYHKREQVSKAVDALGAFENLAATDRTPLGRALSGAVPAWKALLAELEEQAREEAKDSIPNAFLANNPITPDQGRMLFRGRDATVREIESLLADPQSSTPMVLLAPRRCGKTSLLRMLPVMLPDALCVFFDLQDNNLKSIESFVRDLVKQTQLANARERRIAVPELNASGGADPVEAAAQWLEELERAAGNRRVLLSLDEFERMEELFGRGDRRELLRLMGLFRATIQHRRKVRLLISGAYPFDELGAIWDDHFINAREIRMGHLDPESALDLLTRPVPEFPEDAIPREVAEKVIERTGCQPYLLQLFGSILVSRLNELKRKTAALDDVAPVEAKVISQGAGYFRDTVRRAPEDARAVLEAFARGESPVIGANARRWLRRRCLLTDDGSATVLAVPVFAEFVRQEVLA